MLSPTPPIDRPSLRPGTGYLIAPRVPHGLATVVESLTREVLRHRPEDIYVFAARHFEKLLKLREDYHAEEYSDRAFSHEFSRDFNLWPTKETRNLRKPPNGGWSLEKEIEIFERGEQVTVDAEESQEDVSTDKEIRKSSRQACSRGAATVKKTSKKSKDNKTTSDARATRIISQMSALPGKNIQTKDIKQELRKNKLSGEKSKTDSIEKGIRGDRRSSRAKAPKTDEDPADEVERATTTTTSSSRTSARRPLKKVRRVETESETETEHETAALENRHVRSSVKDCRSSREAIARTGSRERRLEARLSEHSSERKVSSRALSMDRIRAYVLRKFASTASLEVLRSPTYVEQVQEVIDRAAPIIKEKLEEIGRPRGKRSKSVDLSWNDGSLYRHVREERGHDERQSERGKSGKLERETDIVRKEETEDSFRRDETEREEKQSRRRSAGSGKRSRRRESGDFGVVDQVDDNSKHSNKLEHESGATRDTLEARLTTTQNILEDISKSTSELGGARRSDPVGSEPSEYETSDQVNVVSLPVVRPPSSKNSRSATKNGSDNVTLPPISPEAPKSTKKKDELSLPILPTATNNGNHSARKPQEQDISKDAEEASTLHDITSDIEDMAVLPDGHEDTIVGAKQNLGSDHQDLTSGAKFVNEEKLERDENINRIFKEDVSAKLDEKRGSLEEFEELEELEEGRKSEEVFRDSLNVTPEVANILDLLETDEDKAKLQNDNVDPARENTFDRLKDKLIEIEMAERSIEKALACQQVATCDTGEIMSQAEKSVTDRKINEAREPTNEAEKTMSEKRKSIDAGKIPINRDDEKRKKNNDDEKRQSMNEEIKETEISSNMKDLNLEERLSNGKINKAEKIENKIKDSTNKTENLNKIETLEKELKKLKNDNEAEKLKSEAKISKNEVEEVTNKTEVTIKTTDNTIKIQDEKLMGKTEKLINENVSNDVEELAIKVHVKNLQSTNSKSYDESVQGTEVIETDGDNNTTSKENVENAANKFSKGTTSENVTIKNESSITNPPKETGKTQEERKKREIDKLPVLSPLSLEVPYSYVLSEGSPCEIPDSVTTVIFPDRPCCSPVILNENYQFKSMNQKGKSVTRFGEKMVKEISKDERQEKDQHRYDMEIFGEYVQPETIPLPDTDFKRSVKGKSSQDITIVHQDLDRIKEEGEEETEKETDDQKEIEDHREKENDKKTVKEEETKTLLTLENIVEHEENEETDVKITESKDTEEISSSGLVECASVPDIRDLTTDIGLTNEEKTDGAIESKSALENSSEESGSTQDTNTPTSSDVKESTGSNRSIESPSPGRPVVPELNLDSLQDNTVSSFKITANGTEKEDNGSPRESDATISLIEPLISDERLINQPVTADHEKEIVAEESRNLQSEIPETDQLYRAEHTEYELLGKDPMSPEINLEDKTKSQEKNIDSKGLSEDDVQVEKVQAEELESEEEIARELIGLLDKDMQLQSKELDLKQESKDSGESEKSSINVDDKSNRALTASMHSMLVEQEKRQHQDSLDKVDEIVRTETTSELSDNVADISKDNKNENSEIIDKETGKVILEMVEGAHIENSQIAPLAHFEQDELLTQNSRSETVDRIISKSTSDTIKEDIQEKFEDKQVSVEETAKIQSNDAKIEQSIKKQEENKQELQSQEKREQGTLEAYEECNQEKLDVQEEIKQEKLKIQSKDNPEDIKMKEEIIDATIPIELINSSKDSKNESIKNDDEHEETKPNNETIINVCVKEDTKTKTEKETEDLSGKIESVHGPITSAISEQSTEDHSRFKHWTTAEMKSSTVETVIETFVSNTSTDEKTKIVADASEIIANESLIRKKDDFHSAVVKIQACIRGFLARRRARRDLNSKFVSSNVPPTKTVTSNRLMVPQDTSNLRESRRLRREEALRNTTLSLENAFATGRLQHTGEFHDSVPLLPCDLINNTNLVASNNSLDEKIEAKEANSPDIAKPSASNGNDVRDSEHGASFHKGNTYVDPTFPIVMHLLTDASHNCHFTVSQNSHSDFNASAGGEGLVKPTVDILMLGYPRDDENQYLNFITSVEDLGSNMNSLTLDDMMKSAKNIDDAHPSTISGEGSPREPLALSDVSRGVVIEEVTSLDELVPSESTKPSSAPKTSLDTNSSMPSDECDVEDAKNDLGMSSRTTDAAGDWKQRAEGQESDRNHENVEESDLRSEDANKSCNETSGEHVKEEKDDKT